MRWSEHDSLVITLIYAAAWAIMLMNGGWYWDDWCTTKMTFAGARLWASMIGQVWQPLYWMFLSRVHGANYIAHWMIFGGYLACALLLNRIMSTIPGIDRTARVLVPSLFAVFPVNHARFAVINFQYTAALVAFYLAAYLISRDLARPSSGVRALSGVLFFGAMLTMNSLMMYIALVGVYVIIVRWDDLAHPRSLARLALRYGFLVALPFLALFVRNRYMRPWGIYATYNVVKKGAYTDAWQWVWQTVLTSFSDPLVLSSAVGLLFAVPVLLLLYRGRHRIDGSMRVNLVMMLVGIIAFVLAVYPYLAVGKFPQSGGSEPFDSRHQVLVPLGAALFCYAVVMLLARLPIAGRALALGAFSVLLGVSIVSDLGMSVAYQADWYKQTAIMQEMGRNRALFDSANAFVFRDDTINYNAYGRRYQEYEYAGMMDVVFGGPTRIGGDLLWFGPWKPNFKTYMRYEQYHYRRIRRPYTQREVTIAPGRTDVTDPGTVSALMFYQLVAPSKFERQVRDIVTLEASSQPKALLW